MGIYNGNIMLYLLLLHGAGGIHSIIWVYKQFTVGSYCDEVEGCRNNSGLMVANCCLPLLLERSHQFISVPDE